MTGVISACLPSPPKYLGMKGLIMAGKVHDRELSRRGGFLYLDEPWIGGNIDFTKKAWR